MGHGVDSGFLLPFLIPFQNSLNRNNCRSLFNKEMKWVLILFYYIIFWHYKSLKSFLYVNPNVLGEQFQWGTLIFDMEESRSLGSKRMFTSSITTTLILHTCILINTFLHYNDTVVTPTKFRMPHRYNTSIRFENYFINDRDNCLEKYTDYIRWCFMSLREWSMEYVMQQDPNWITLTHYNVVNVPCNRSHKLL